MINHANGETAAISLGLSPWHSIFMCKRIHF